MDEEVPYGTQRECHRSLACRIAAMMGLLVSKGVFTVEEFDTLVALCESDYDQRQAAADEKFSKTEAGKVLAMIKRMMGD